MQSLLAALAVLGSLLGLAYAAAARRALLRPVEPVPRPGLGRVFALAALSLVTLFWLTRIAAPPFAEGGSLGMGLLAGGGIALLVLALSGPIDAPPVGPLAAACLGPAALLYAMRGYPNEALVGCALGALLVAALADALLRPRLSIAPGAEDGAAAGMGAALRDVERYALAATAVAVGARLAIDHFPRATPDAVAGGYWPAPALLLLVGALAFALMAEGGAAPPRRLAQGALAGLGVAAAAALLQFKLLPALDWRPVAEGLAAFGLLLFAPLQEAEGVEGRRPALTFGGLILLLALMGMALGQLRGYGQALFLLPALCVAAPLWPGRPGSARPLAEASGAGAVAIALLIVLDRFFLDRVGRGHSLDFQQQYDLIAVLLGIAAPFALLAAHEAARARPERLARELPRLLGVCAAPLLAPLVLAAMWGERTAGSYLIGLIGGEMVWLLGASWLEGRDRARVLAAPPHVYVAASAVATVQLTPLAAALTPTRAYKLGLLGLLVVAALLLAGLDALGRAPVRRPADEPAL